MNEADKKRVAKVRSTLNAYVLAKSRVLRHEKSSVPPELDAAVIDAKNALLDAVSKLPPRIIC